MRWLDLSRLRSKAANLTPQEQTLVRNFPELRHQLEYSIRVWLNHGNEDVAIEDIPRLPLDSLILDVRPGILLAREPPIGDTTSLDAGGCTTDCYSPSRLLHAGRRILPRISLDGSSRDVPHFAAVDHADEDYDLYLERVDLVFKFHYEGTVYDLAFGRYMDDAPEQESLGSIAIEADRLDERPSLEEILKAILQPKRRRGGNESQEDADADGADDDDAGADDDADDGGSDDGESENDEGEDHGDQSDRPESDEGEEEDEDQEVNPSNWPRPQANAGEEDSDDEGGDEEGDVSEEDDDKDDDGAPRGRTVSGGSCFRRFIYAIRSHDGKLKGRKRKQRTKQKLTAAASRSGGAFYGIIDINRTERSRHLLLNRAPVHAPFFWDPRKQAAWDPERKPATKRGFFLYNDDIAFDLYR